MILLFHGSRSPGSLFSRLLPIQFSYSTNISHVKSVNNMDYRGSVWIRIWLLHILTDWLKWDYIPKLMQKYINIFLMQPSDTYWVFWWIIICINNDCLRRLNFLVVIELYYIVWKHALMFTRQYDCLEMHFLDSISIINDHMTFLSHGATINSQQEHIFKGQSLAWTNQRM